MILLPLLNKTMWVLFGNDQAFISTYYFGLGFVAEGPIRPTWTWNQLDYELDPIIDLSYARIAVERGAHWGYVAGRTHLQSSPRNPYVHTQTDRLTFTNTSEAAWRPVNHLLMADAASGGTLLALTPLGQTVQVAGGDDYLRIGEFLLRIRDRKDPYE